MPYFIYLNERAEFVFDIENFQKVLLAKWLDVNFEEDVTQNVNPHFSWNVEINGDFERCSLHSDLRTISIDGYPEGVAPFAIWYRKLIPLHYRVFISHDSSDEEIEVTQNMEEIHLIDILNSM